MIDVSDREINTDRKHRIGVLSEPPSDDFEIEFYEDEKGFGTFTLKFKEFERFSQYDRDTVICVILKKKGQSALFVCGLLYDFRESKFFSSEKQKGNGMYRKTEKTIIGIPNSAEVQFVTPTGKKLYQWVKRVREPARKEGRKTPGQRAIGSLVDHVDTQNDEVASIMFVNLDKDNERSEVIWNRHLFYEDLTDREKLLVSQQIMNEILNYAILVHLTDKDEAMYEVDLEDSSSLSVIKQYLEHLNKKALDIFKENSEKVSPKEYMEWKRNMLAIYCEEMEIVERIQDILSKNKK